MREDNIKDTKREKAIIKSRRMSIIGFIVAIALLTTAIVLAMNQEKAERQAKLDESLNSNNITISTNGKMGRNINEVRNELKLEAKKENAVSDSNSVDSKSASTDLSENNINNVNNVKQNDVISTNASSVSGKDGKIIKTIQQVKTIKTIKINRISQIQRIMVMLQKMQILQKIRQNLLGQ